MQLDWKMLVCVVLLAAVCGTVIGECEFPSNHPSFSQPEQSNLPEQLLTDHVYVYTDEFDNCRGCVSKVNFCYLPSGGSSSETILTVMIRNNGGQTTTSLGITVDPGSDGSDRTINCISDGLDSPYCCIRQTPMEPFSVGQNDDYALRTESGVNSRALRDRHVTTNGHKLNANTDVTISGPVYKPFFFFTINPDDNNCSDVPTTTTTASDSPTDSDTDSMPSTEGNTDAPTSDSSTDSDTDSMPSTEGNTDAPTSDSSTDSDTDSMPSTEGNTDAPTSDSSTDSDAESTTSSSTGGSNNDATDPAVNDALQNEGESSGSSAGAVGGAIGAVLAIILLLTVAVIAVLLCIRKRKKSPRKVLVRRVGEADGFNNEMYGVTDEGDVTAGKGPEPVYCTPVDTGKANTYIRDPQKAHQYEHMDDLPMKTVSEDPSPYAYTYVSPDSLPQSTGLPTEYSYAVTGAEASAGKRPSLHYEESIYEAPASSERGLYAQFEKIRVTQIPHSKIEITECLGSGQFGTVHRGAWQSSPGHPTHEVAIKTLKSSAKEGDRVKFLQEGAIMGQFRHSNVVELYGIVREGPTVLLVIELLAKTDLREHLINLRPEPDEEVDFSLPHTLLSYCRQVAAGMDYLSKKRFIHRDIAARNILISEDHETCKIADFGMSRDLADETYYISSGGKIPVKWTAPEALHFKKYSTASDVWSFGCLMYEIWSLGHKPFEAYTNSNAMKLVEGGFRLPPPPGCPRALYSLMINCWHPTTSNRPSASSLAQSLARSDPVLLKWAESDKPAGSPLALQLGAALESAAMLYTELQRTYSTVDPADNDYEEPT